MDTCEQGVGVYKLVAEPLAAPCPSFLTKINRGKGTMIQKWAIQPSSMQMNGQMHSSRERPIKCLKTMEKNYEYWIQTNDEYLIGSVAATCVIIDSSQSSPKYFWLLCKIPHKPGHLGSPASAIQGCCLGIERCCHRLHQEGHCPRQSATSRGSPQNSNPQGDSGC